jgi:hypothetical protein
MINKMKEKKKDLNVLSHIGRDLYICYVKVIMFDYEILYHVEREKEKLTKLSSTKKFDELIHSIEYKMTFSIKFLMKQLYLFLEKKNKKKKNLLHQHYCYLSSLLMMKVD